MIRINILRNRGGGSNLRTSVTNMTGISFSSSGEDSGSSADDNKVLIKKALMALVLPLVIIGYDQYAKSEKSSQLTVLQQEKASLQQKVTSFGPKAESVKKFQQEKDKLIKRIEVIKAISAERLRVIKALDTLHRTVPQQAWLSELTVRDGYQVKIVGFALDDFVVSNLIQNLDESIFFTNVKLVSSQEHTGPEGKLRKYEVSGQLGEY